MRLFRLSLIIILLLTLGLGGCGPSGKQWKPDREKKVYGAVHHQHAAEPVYNRLRWVHLPDTMPPREVESGGPRYFPVVHLELQKASMQEAASTLASLARYRSYCASTIADRKISINALGTLDELAAQIAQAEKIEVSVDHENGEVRFLARQVVPAFANSEVLGHESKQAD